MGAQVDRKDLFVEIDWMLQAMAGATGGMENCTNTIDDDALALEKSMELRRGGDGFDWFFLAMAEWQLGKKEDGREWYRKAVEWMEKNAKENGELRRFRGEAEELMGIDPRAVTQNGGE